MKLQAPNPFATFKTRGATYIADANGVVTAPLSDVNDLIASGCVELAISEQGVDVYTLTVDPGVSQDSTQGYVPGSLFGSFGEEGNLYRSIANPISQNAADLTDDILGGFVVPANAFDVAGRGIQLTAQGKFGATANNKRFKVWANPAMAGQTVTAGVISGGTVTGAGSGILLFDSGVQVNNATGWALLLQLFKYGIAGANTQYSQSQPIYGATHGGVQLPVFSTLPENAAINLVVTGASPTTGAAGDVVLNFFEANCMN